MTNKLEPRLELVRRLVHQHAPADGRVLEVSCGKAPLLVALKEDGFDVRGTNFTQYPGAAADVPIDSGVDLMKGTPYEDGQFDCVMLLDVVEHLSDHQRAVAEVRRVLKHDGVLIVLTPNIMRINSRLHFLFTGFFKIKRSFVGFDVPAERAFAFHNHPVRMPVFLYHLTAHDLHCAQVAAFQYKPKSILMWLLLAPWIAVSTWLNCRWAERHLRGSPAGRRLVSTLTSFQALNGESIVLVARKLQAEARRQTTRLPEWSKPHTDEAKVADQSNA